MLVPVSQVELQVIPDEWTGLPPFTPGERYLPAGTIRVVTSKDEIVIPAAVIRACGPELLRDVETVAELVRRLGTLAPARPAGTDAYGNSYPKPPDHLIHAVRNGNGYRFASGGLVVQ